MRYFRCLALVEDHNVILREVLQNFRDVALGSSLSHVKDPNAWEPFGLHGSFLLLKGPFDRKLKLMNQLLQFPPKPPHSRVDILNPALTARVVPHDDAVMMFRG